DLPPVLASLNHLTVVFRNLLDNAIKYTPEGGQITWSINADRDGIRHVIQDTGRGIEPDQLPHLFERFYRADKARSRDIPGTGLGLAIVKSIVDAYGGTISIESAGIGKGSSVTVCLPLSPSAPKNRPPAKDMSGR
ncbi:MAG TPA: ATP-binding protein, partial [Phototrophicaceae bacterium]|nr:ATP-binding protein [Phototrophicaceae bacterium]